MLNKYLTTAYMHRINKRDEIKMNNAKLCHVAENNRIKPSSIDNVNQQTEI